MIMHEFMLTAHTMVVAGVVPAATVIEAATNLIGDIIAFLGKGAAGVALGFVIWRALKGKFQIGAIVSAGLAGGLFLWFVFGGYEWIQTLFKNQANDSGLNALGAMVHFIPGLIS